MLANLTASSAEAYSVRNRNPVGAKVPAQALPLCAARLASADQVIWRPRFLFSHLSVAATGRRSRASAYVCRALGPRASAASAAPDEPESAEVDGDENVVRASVNALKAQFVGLKGLWGQLLPMTALFSCMAFANTLLDSTKDTLVITAVNGGVEQIPFLLVYVVFPSSLLFLFLFSFISSHTSRRTTFNIVVGTFLSFFAFFAVFLFPNAETLHAHPLADHLQSILPPGLAGLVMCLRNWTYTLFYVAAELWGDVILSLLFWGLANDTTALTEAPLLYPLFGIGANAAQSLAGLFLTQMGGITSAVSATPEAAWALSLNVLLAAVGVVGAIMCVLHSWILARAGRSGKARDSALGSRKERASGAAGAAAKAAAAAKPSLSLRDSFAYVASSPQIQCLALCAIAQGVSSNLMEFAWKSHLRVLHPTPASFSAFMGEVATVTGLLTGGLMLVSPVMFGRLGWRGAAQMTPRILFWGGSAFFGMAILRPLLVNPAFTAVFGGAAAAAGATAADILATAPLLQPVVLLGAALYIFSRASKYALFKPAEEMVYISLDEETRTKGKAAIDVVGNQVGKSSGSLINQTLLLLCGGSLVGVLPVMLVAFLLMVRRWLSAVGRLSEIRVTPHAAAAAAAAAAEADAAAAAKEA